MPFNKKTWLLTVTAGMPFLNTDPKMSLSFVHNFFRCGRGTPAAVRLISDSADHYRNQGKVQLAALTAMWATIAWAAGIGRSTEELSRELRQLATLLHDGVPRSSTRAVMIQAAEVLGVHNPTSTFPDDGDWVEAGHQLRRLTLASARKGTWSDTELQRRACWATLFAVVDDRDLRTALANAVDAAAGVFEAGTASR